MSNYDRAGYQKWGACVQAQSVEETVVDVLRLLKENPNESSTPVPWAVVKAISRHCKVSGPTESRFIVRPSSRRRAMGQILHGSATTTEAVRRAIQNSQASLRELAVRYGIKSKDRCQMALP